MSGSGYPHYLLKHYFLRRFYRLRCGAAGFGALKDQVWRIGLMGYSSRKENVILFLVALRELLKGNNSR